MAAAHAPPESLTPRSDRPWYWQREELNAEGMAGVRMTHRAYAPWTARRAGLPRARRADDKGSVVKHSRRIGRVAAVLTAAAVAVPVARA
jgi:hypothetical protein